MIARGRPSACCDPIERRRRPTCTGRGSRLCASAWRWRPDARPSIATSTISARPRDLADGRDAAIVELCGGHRPDAPEPLDRERVEEGRLAVGRHDQQTVGLGDPARHLGEELGAGHADGDRQTRPARARRCRNRAAISAGVPETRLNPPTSRNASSIDSPSTSGVVCSNTSNTALLASEYADIRGSTTIARGHSRRACRPPIAVRTPNALAS